jgi:alkylation response protein AidB-like acyl-CoA dehydrogenase
MLDEHLFADQRDLQETIRAVLQDTLPPLRERDTGTARAAAAADLRKRLTEIGVPGIGIDDRYGGSGGGITELAVVARELGRVLAPASVVSSALAAALLQAAGGDSGARLLGELAAGQRAALAVPQPGWDPWGSQQPGLTERAAQGGRLTISGPLRGVIDADDAAWLLVLVPALGPETTARLLALDARHPGLRTNTSNDIAVVRTFSAVSLDAVPATAHPVTPGQARLAVAAGSLLLAYEMLGAAEAAIDLAARHATTREQFGRPIGTFQAVSHRLAAAYIELQAAAAAASYALRGHRAPAFGLAADAARATGVECLTECCETATQVFGAIAFTWEHPLHHYLKYAKTCARLLAPGRRIEAEIVAFLEGED